jgi:hypothetical protein
MGDRAATAYVGDIEGHVVANLASNEWDWNHSFGLIRSLWADIYDKDATSAQVLA